MLALHPHRGQEVAADPGRPPYTEVLSQPHASTAPGLEAGSAIVHLEFPDMVGEFVLSARGPSGWWGWRGLLTPRLPHTITWTNLEEGRPTMWETWRLRPTS